MTAVAIPVFSAQLEKSRNAVDIHTAKTVADVVTLYFLAHPEAMEELNEISKGGANLHCVQVSVDGNAAVINPIFQPALLEAGLVDSFYRPNYTRDLTCKSKENWGGYRVVVTTWDDTKGKLGDFQIYFRGFEPGYTKTHGYNNLSMYSESDATGFKDAMGGG